MNRSRERWDFPRGFSTATLVQLQAAVSLPAFVCTPLDFVARVSSCFQTFVINFIDSRACERNQNDALKYKNVWLDWYFSSNSWEDFRFQEKLKLVSVYVPCFHLCGCSPPFRPVFICTLRRLPLKYVASAYVHFLDSQLVYPLFSAPSPFSV